MSTQRKVNTSEFLAAHPVFTLDEAAEAFASHRGKKAATKRLRRYVEDGRLKLLERGLYAVVPPRASSQTFQPDPFLAANAARPDSLFCYHSALELLGVAHSVWKKHSVFTKNRRPPLRLHGSEVLFLDHPVALRKNRVNQLGTRNVERLGFLLRVTGPERTLVEGFRRPDLVGGLPELTNSASGFATLDLKLLTELLKRYGERKLWGAVGWFLEKHQTGFHVPDDYLRRLEAKRPRSPLYLPRRQRGGVLSPRWNVILPAELSRGDHDGR